MTSKTRNTEALTARLRHVFSTQQIADYADMLAQMQALGLNIDDVMTDGMPAPDTLVLKTVVPMLTLDDVIAKMQKREFIRRIEIFPWGIPVQDAWRMRVGIGRK
jgi:hypothetical protein